MSDYYSENEDFNLPILIENDIVSHDDNVSKSGDARHSGSGETFGRPQRNTKSKMTPAQRLDNLSDVLTAKPVRSRAKKQLEVLVTEQLNPMAADASNSRKKNVRVSKSTSSTGSTTRGRGRGRGGKSGSSARAPAGLCDVQELAAAYGDLGYTHPRS